MPRNEVLPSGTSNSKAPVASRSSDSTLPKKTTSAAESSSIAHGMSTGARISAPKASSGMRSRMRAGRDT